MLKKKVNIKGLKKKILNFEYEQDLLARKTLFENKTLKNPKNPKTPETSKLCKGSEKKVTSPLLDRDTTNNSLVDKAKNSNVNFRILILRSEPIKQKIEWDLTSLDENLKNIQLHSKCIKKNVLKKTVLNFNTNKNFLNENWLKCKYIYWLTPDALSLKEQFLHLNLLKSYLRAEPRDAFLGCLIESRLEIAESVLIENTKKEKVNFLYNYYYPAQILDLCDSLDKFSVSNSSTGLEILGQLFYTLDSSINSISNMLVLKKELLEENTGTSN